MDLRIPVTLQQKEMIYAALQGAEFASWTREVLLREAGRVEEMRNSALGARNGETGASAPGDENGER